MTNETQAAVAPATIANQVVAANALKAAKAKPAKVGTKAKAAAKRPSKPIITKPAAKAPAKKAAKPKAPAKKAAKPAKAKAKAKPTGDRLVPANLETYVKDNEHKTPAGSTSVHCGDDVAKRLLGKSLDQVYAMAAKALKEDEKALRAKYKHLNAGMQRMNLGNRMRAAA